MATITPSALISEIRGRVGSEIFSKNLYGAYVKTSYAPTNPNTTFQQSARTRFNAARSAWDALSDAQKTGWYTKSLHHPVSDRLGQPKILTPQQFYISRYLSLATIGFTPSPNAIRDFENIRVGITFTASISSGISVNWSTIGNDSQWELVLSMSAPMSPTIFKPPRGRVPFLQSIFTFFSPPEDVTFNYTARHGALTGLAGQKIFATLHAVRYNTGQTTVKQQVSAIITA